MGDVHYASAAIPSDFSPGLARPLTCIRHDLHIRTADAGARSPPRLGDPNSREHDAYDGEMDVDLFQVNGQEIVIGSHVDGELEDSEDDGEDEVAAGDPE